jgi:putative transposase
MTLILTNQNVKLKNDKLSFPRVFKGFSIKSKFIEREDFKSFQQVRFVPKQKYIIVELVYKIEVPDELEDNGRYMSIDIGVDNLATITNNYGETPIIVNGKGLKSMNQYYNKTISHYRSIAKQHNNYDYTNKMVKLTNKRNFKITDSIHKASRFIVNKAVEQNVSVIVVGHNKGWKQSSNMSKRNNQSFVDIPFNDLIHQIQYKAQEKGIKVIFTEESYTSGTSFLDNELPEKQFYNKSRRKYRGLFRSNNGVLINADVNGSYQILKKVFPNAYANGIEGVVLHPVKVGIC